MREPVRQIETIGLTTENGETTVCLGDVVDQLLDKHSLADTGTSEETNLTTTSVRGKKVHDLDTGFQNFSSGRLFNERGGIIVNGEELVTLDRSALVNGFTNNVHDAAKSALADGNHDGITSVNDPLTTDETLSTVHGNGTDRVLAKVGSNLEDKTTAVEVLDLESIENGGKVLAVELHVDDGTNDGFDVTTGLRLRRVAADLCG